VKDWGHTILDRDAEKARPYPDGTASYVISKICLRALLDVAMQRLYACAAIHTHLRPKILDATSTACPCATPYRLAFMPSAYRKRIK